MRYICQLDSLLCRVDKHFLHSYDSYNSTTIERGHVANMTSDKFLSPLNEMQINVHSTVYFVHWYIMLTVLDNPPSSASLLG